MSTKNEKHLYYLSELSGYKITSGDHDIRGWAVKDRDNRVIGKVDNLMVNKDLGKVVYIDVDVDKSIIDANHDPFAEPTNPNVREFINKDGENHFIIPIGMVSLNPESKYVYTETIDYRTFAETKRYQSGNTIDRDYERAVLTSYNRDRRDNVNHDRDNVERTRTAYNDNDDHNLVDRDRDHDRDLRNDDDFSRRNENHTKEEIAAERLRLERDRLENERLAEKRKADYNEKNYDQERNREQSRVSDRDDNIILDRDHDRLSRDNETTEERIRREKANMRYKSEDPGAVRRDEPVTDRDRSDYDDKWRKNTGSTNEDLDEYRRENKDTSWKDDSLERPVRTHDEDKNWTREDRDLDKDEAFRKQKRSDRDIDDDDFYDRNEFRNRNY